MNSVTFVGRLGGDAEQRYTTSGTAVSSFSLAVDRQKKQGQKQAPIWLRVSLWGKQAEALTSFLTKGKQVAVQGELDVREYNDKAGEKRVSVEVQGRQITLLSGGEAKQNQATAASTEAPDEDMPF